MSGHLLDTQLALCASGDLGGWSRLTAAWHVRRCAGCRERLGRFAEDRRRLATDLEMPEGVEWELLAREMAANVRVGLAAGECVASPVAEVEPTSWNWQPVGAAVGLMAVFCAAWWLNVPSGDTAKLLSALGMRRSVSEDRGPMVEASDAGVAFRENGSALGLSGESARPLAVTISFDGSASAQYVDETGQMTIAKVYTQ
jgi:hypothetical protein